MAQAERCLRTFGITRRVTSHQVKRNRSLHRQNCAVIASRKGMGVAVRLAGVEKKDVVGVGDQRVAAMRPAEKTPADEHDAVRGIRLFGSLVLDMGPTPEIENRDPDALD